MGPLLPDAQAAPEPDEAPAPFLPGAPPPSPLKLAERLVERLTARAARLERRGSRLKQRIQSGDSPSQAERRAYIEAEKLWDLNVRLAQADLEHRSLSQAAGALDELRHVRGPRLHEISVHLGGE